tara:strand:+ start:375 stop:1484 length:1110 start_codon:yes stop_codon:yes gene_type:complete
MYFLILIYSIKIKIIKIFYKNYNPYNNKNIKGYNFSPSNIINERSIILANNRLNRKVNLITWKIESKKKLLKLLGIEEEKSIIVLSKKKSLFKKKYILEEYIIRLEKNRNIPIQFLYKKEISNYLGYCICLQGTNSGAHLSLGKIILPYDWVKIKNKCDLSIQAAANNYIAISYDRIGFGIRKEIIIKSPLNKFHTINPAFHFLSQGSTLLGQDCLELNSIIKWLKKNDNKKNIFVVGYSAAGTTAIFSAAINDSIDAIVVGGCVGLYSDTIMKRGTAGYENIPNLLNHFDLDLIISLIAPKFCSVIAGDSDHIWPYKNAKKVHDNINIFFKENIDQNNFNLIKANEGHTYYPELMWPEVKRIYNKLKK